MFVYSPVDAAPRYAYLLGIYLGDGHISRHGRTASFVVVLDAAFPGIVAETRIAMDTVHPGARIAIRRHPVQRCFRVVSYSLTWLALFPQHGPGRKHERPIVLDSWQRSVVEREPEAFLRGLIHSDGCRTINRFRTRLPSGRVAEYAYPRYFFSNLSGDIRGLFCGACDQVGICWTQSNHRNISVSHRGSVARLDGFIGPKT